MSKIMEYAKLKEQIEELENNNEIVPVELIEKRKELYIDALIEYEESLEYEIVGGVF